MHCSVRIGLSVIFLFSQFAAADIEISLAGPTDTIWQKRVDDTWRPRAKQTVNTYRQLAEIPMGAEISSAVRIVLASNAEEAKQAISEMRSHHKPLVLELDGKFSTSKINNLVVRQTAKDLMLQLLDDLAQGKSNQTPQWLREGSTNWLAAEVFARVGDDPAADWFQQTSSWLRRNRDIPDPALFLTIKEGQEKQAGFSNTAGLMVSYLHTRLGERFLPSLASYYRAAGKAGFESNHAFTQSFGITPNAFLVAYRTWAEQIRTEKRQHAGAIPPATIDALVSDLKIFPLTDEAARKGLTAYADARAPKAFALSTRGRWTYMYDNPNAMADALRRCQKADPIDCQLYAVDDHVVYKATPEGNAAVEVRMASTGDDPWTSAIREKWHPMSVKVAASFSKLAQEKIGVGLNENALIHLTSGSDDFSRIMEQEMGLSHYAANTSSELFGGLSNGRGQIAIAFRTSMKEKERYERATKTTAHELIHELQGQLSRRYKGFRAQVWISEGTADLLGFEIIDQAQIPRDPEVSLAEWKKTCIEKYRNNSSRYKIADFFTNDYSAWRKLTSEKKEPYPFAGLMAQHLQALTGQRFYSSWVTYFKLASQPGQKEEIAFEQSFGISQAAFQQSFQQWLNTL